MPAIGRIQAQRLKEREREYGRKRAAIDQRLATEKKEIAR